ncbi:alanine--tRNA ligase [Rubrivirga sp. S365]|uniref:alanine--tRNA ligase n=1 Tax=Rubrivirga sp. S365 TaxID=3076080 RepID=UPI0028C69447|nr:alanine--tRNA ligase [Rubrivirga sp. S365]MDT7857026.1 alanine--tRNA ligase [Rubrivirga sp. S365]
MPRTSAEIRQSFLDFFAARGHEVVPSAPLVPQDDPTLLFVNAGMNPFKDVFLGTGSRPYSRAVDTQKCLRVSGKHNDLDEVGLDTYHHTFFEMLGNWSFGDYFKKEAIRWAWELLVDEWGLDPDRLYVTVHEGDEALGLAPDQEAADLWASETSVRPAHVLFQGSADNFWMMGETGPCGPCSEIHVDLRDDHERAVVPGQDLVNQDDPRVMEIWNLVFMEYNAVHASDGTPAPPDADADPAAQAATPIRLQPLAAKHVDTGMGFERICAVLQGKRSNYDTDLFAGLLAALSDRAGLPAYDRLDEADADERRQRIAMRVIVDHVRTLAFAVADGAQPSNTGRGYVIRRILRRAVRYGYQGLGLREPFLASLLPALAESMGGAFPELVEQQEAIGRIVTAEEEAFLRTLEGGIELIEGVFELAGLEERDAVLRNAASSDRRSAGLMFVNTLLNSVGAEMLPDYGQSMDYWPGKTGRLVAMAYGDSEPAVAFSDFVDKVLIDEVVPGEVAFLLHDTYGFPSDLTAVMARERGLTVDEARFDELMAEQRERARAAAGFSTKDQGQIDTWDPTADAHTHDGRPIAFLGYDALSVDGARILKTRTVGGAEGDRHELVLDRTPFYAESGGQVGDTGTLRVGGEEIAVLDTVKDAEGTIIHVVDRLPAQPDADVGGAVDADRRRRITRHHTATHLLHAALRETLGDHVQQKGSLVAPDRLRFDFSHFERLTDDERRRVTDRVNELVLRNVPKGEERDVPIAEAKARGATALFGEKYGEHVRVITFDPDVSLELCGGTHVASTGEVGLFQIVSEGSVASGVRRVEAVAGEAALAWLRGELDELDDARARFKQIPDGLGLAVEGLQHDLKALEATVAGLRQEQAAAGLGQYLADAADVDGVRVATGRVDGADMDALRGLAETARERLGSGGVAVFGSAADGKAVLAASVTDDLVQRGVQAGKLVGALAKRVGGGGGGRPTLATAGGKNPAGLDDALGAAAEEVRALLG